MKAFHWKGSQGWRDVPEDVMEYLIEPILV